MSGCLPSPRVSSAMLTARPERRGGPPADGWRHSRDFICTQLIIHPCARSDADHVDAPALTVGTRILLSVRIRVLPVVRIRVLPVVRHLVRLILGLPVRATTVAEVPRTPRTARRAGPVRRTGRGPPRSLRLPGRTRVGLPVRHLARLPVRTRVRLPPGRAQPPAWDSRERPPRTSVRAQGPSQLRSGLERGPGSAEMPSHFSRGSTGRACRRTRRAPPPWRCPVSAASRRTPHVVRPA